MIWKIINSITMGISSIALIISMLSYQTLLVFIYGAIAFVSTGLLCYQLTMEQLNKERVEDRKRIKKELFDECLANSRDWYECIDIAKGE